MDNPLAALKTPRPTNRKGTVVPAKKLSAVCHLSGLPVTSRPRQSAQLDATHPQCDAPSARHRPGQGRRRGEERAAVAR